MGNSIWKKEISLRRTPKDVFAPLDDAAAEAESEVAVHAPPLPAGDYGWLTVDFDPDDVPDAMPTIVAPSVTLPARTEEAKAKRARRGLKLPNPELKLPKRKQKEAKPAKEPKAEKEQAPPFWKRELKLSRPKLERTPKELKQPQEPKEQAPPFWKRELKLSRPKLERTPKEAKQPKEQAPPFWKRELKLSRPKLERKPKQAKQGKPAKPGKAAKTAAKGAVVGLKIGASQVAAARVTNGASPHLLQVARVPLPDGVVVGGELRDVEGLAQALKELFTKNKLPKRGVRLGIANNRIGVRTFEIAGIDDARQLANAIRFRAQETLPIPLEEAVLDWQVLDEWVDEDTGTTTRRVLLVVAYRELVDRYVAACKKAGLKLEGIDLEAFAMLRALSPPGSEDAVPAAGARVVVNVGHDRSTFAVSAAHICEFTRVLPWGGQSLSVAIARALDLTPSEARPIKHAVSLVAQTEPPEGVSAEALATARDAVVRELQSFARELVSSLRFYQNQPGSLGIAEVVLTGGTAHLPGLSDELNRLIGVPVRVGDPLNRVVVPKKFRTPDDVEIGSLAVAIGLGIED